MGRDHTLNTFLLGTGCMKGGTTWLHRYLAASPQCEPGYRKEYHVFDTSDFSQRPFVIDGVLRRAETSLARMSAGEAADAWPLHLTAMIADTSLYFDYFSGLLSRPGVRLTMDITPGYAGLSPERLESIRHEFQRRQVRTRAVFLLRDPVERIWSHVRMQKRRRPEQNPGTAEELVLQRYQDPVYDVRSRYEPTVRNLDAVFGSDVSYHFFERLFDEDQTRRICEFAGIDFQLPDFDVAYNASPKSAVRLPVSTVQEVALHLRSTYEFVAQRFSDIDLHTVWPSARYVL